MTTSHRAGPDVVFGVSSGPTPVYNPDLSSSLFWGGAGMLDQRMTAYWAYAPGMSSTRGWYGIDNITTLNYTPTALSTTNMANAVTPTTTVPLVLLTASVAGATISASVINAVTGLTVGGLILLDGITASVTGSITGNVFYAASVTNGQLTVGSVLSGTLGATAIATNTTIIAMGGHGGTTGAGSTGTYIISPAQYVTGSTQGTVTANAGINGVPLVPGNVSVSPPQPGNPLGIGGNMLYNPICMMGRNVRITTASSDVGVYTIRGYDIYGYPMTEALTAAGATTVSGKKAFKYIASVTPVGGTLGATASVGTGDVFGFPLLSLSFQDVSIMWSASVITSSTGYTAADLTNPATSTTGDTRGTYAIQTASNGVARLLVQQSPQATQVSSNFGLFGQTQA